MCGGTQTIVCRQCRRLFDVIVRAVVESGQPCPAIELMGWLASDTASPYMVTYNGTAVGKDAYYRGAWETHQGEIGVWSEAVKATITG